ncbi:hypothetical protein MUP01_09650 [Candidatus Bathyarchaeota archaeon]|nr:hypothetical protein [Candidatus Bathyarchaeota archaeon]
MRTRKVEGDLSDRSFEQDLSELRERIVRLEVQLAEVIKKVDGLSSYTRQLFDYLNRPR